MIFRLLLQHQELPEPCQVQARGRGGSGVSGQVEQLHGAQGIALQLQVPQCGELAEVGGQVLDLVVLQAQLGEAEE